MILADNETKVDLLNSESVAQTIVGLIRERPEHPITIGVHGDWGAGKSSVLEMIESNLKSENDKVLCIKFNGWRFQGFEDAKIALIEGIVNELVEKRSLWQKGAEEVKDIFKRINWLKAAKRAGSLLFTAVTGIPDGQLVSSVVNGLHRLASDPSALATPEHLQQLAKEADGLLKPKDPDKNTPKEIAEFRKAFDKLLTKAGLEQLVVLIDDLDRCLPETAIETLEAIRLFIFTEKTAFVIAADEGMIEYAVRRHFPDLPDTMAHQAYTRNYLEKLIQVPFRIPILGEAETKTYVTLLLIGTKVSDSDEGFNKLIGVAREQLKRPWEGLSVNSETVRNCLGDNATAVQPMVLLSEQIGPVLANGTKGNPRQIKRFLNTLLLRKRMAEARGFGDVISLPVLAKLMIAERFIPQFFDQIASESAKATDGKCNDLKLLEESLSQKDDAIPESSSGLKKKSSRNDDSQKPQKEISQMVAGWLSSEGILQWAAIQPLLADVDLRPYIFVAKDKKDFFGTSTVLGHLAALVDKLMGNRMGVKMLSGDIKALSPKEAETVYQELRTRVLTVGDLANLPPGIDGLSALVTVHSGLQEKLVDLLEGLDTEHLGPWAITGWGSVLTGEANNRFNKLVSKWASVARNGLLKAAAHNAQKIAK